MAGLTQEVVITTVDGQTIGVRSAQRAAELYPGHTIVSYGDGRPYDGPAVVTPVTELKRAELNQLAASLGIEHPEGYPNKAALLEAVTAAQQPAATVPDTSGPDPATPVESADGAQ